MMEQSAVMAMVAATRNKANERLRAATRRFHRWLIDLHSGRAASPLAEGLLVQDLSEEDPEKRSHCLHSIRRNFWQWV